MIPASYYLSEDVVRLAQDLLGKILLTRFEGVITIGIISETEAYKAPEDRASHAWNNRRTVRTEVMFATGGTSYVYLCYGIHHLFNVVTGPKDLPHAVLIRAIEPLEGEETMLARRGIPTPRKRWLTGPGSAAQALGLRTHHSGLRLDDPQSPVQLWDYNIRINPSTIVTGPRVGVESAGEDALLPWRFRI